MDRESCYRGCHFNGRENGHVTEVVTLMEGEWSYYGGGQFKGRQNSHSYGGGQFRERRMVHVMVVVSLMECRMVMLQRWSL